MRPVVFDLDCLGEVARDLLVRLHGPSWPVCALLHGGELRLLEALRLRVKDLLNRGACGVRSSPRPLIYSAGLAAFRYRAIQPQSRSTGAP